MTNAVICFSFFVISSFSQTAPKSREAAEIFRSILPRIRAKTSIPIILPSSLPSKAKAKEIKSVEVDSAEDSYKLTLSFGDGCGNACYVGYFGAERRGEVFKDEVDKIVRLAKGHRGYYTGLSCGGSCTPPQISWIQEGVLYTIQFKVNGRNRREDEAEIIATANSAILGGAR